MTGGTDVCPTGPTPKLTIPQDYQTIHDIGAKLPEKVIREDKKLLMYDDVATMRLGFDL